MTTVADTVEQERRQAWRDYAERLQGLDGAEYERVEQEAWQELQAALRALGEPVGRADDALG
jgi:hypothetical protein